MKTKLFFACLALTGLLLHSNVTLAHFGSKGPFGGSVSCGMTYDTLVYIGTSNGGVFFSTKQALTGWSSKPVGLKSGKITALAHTGSYIFSATADSGIFRYTGFVGSDRYWQKVNTGLTNLKIRSLVAIDSITLLAGTEGGGVFKTINKGAAWTSVNTGLSGTSIITGLVKAGTRIIATSQTGGVFKSDNNGATWSSFNDVNTLNVAGTNALSYNSVTDELLVLNNTGLFRIASASTTSTLTYVASQTGLTAGTAVRSISNNGSNWYLATDNGVFTTVAAVINWTSANTNLTTMDVNVVVPVAFSTSRLIAGTNKEGIFKSPASSISWTANNTSFNNLETYSMATSGAQVIIAATEKGVYRSTDLAASYQRANDGLIDSLNVTGLEFLGTNLFASTKNNGVFISADTGKTWAAFNSGLAESNIKKIISTGNVLYIISSTNKIYQSNGFNWVQMQSGLPGGVVPTSIVASGNNVLLGTLGNGAYTRATNTTTWVAANTGLTNLNVTSVTANNGKLFAGTNGGGVFISDASTVSWTHVITPSISHTTLIGLDGTKVQAMISYGGFVLASHKGGLLATLDNGATWIAGGNQFNLPSYTNVNKIAFVNTRVFVTSENNGLYSNALSEFPLYATTSVLANVSCNGLSDGSASVSAAGAAAPYTYAWSTGATTSSIFNLSAQTYTVIVSDAGIKKDTATVTILEPAELNAALTATGASSTTASDGGATAVVIGGTPPYDYFWNTSETTDAITGLPTGDYTLFITDANGCDLMETVYIDVIITGIDVKETGSATITLSPNPSNGIFTVELTNLKSVAKEIGIYDMMGKELQRMAINSNVSQQMEVSYPAGIYFINVFTSDGMLVQKVVIQ